MPRHQVTAPVTTAFRVATPDILRQILLYATTSTLAACIRVSQNFYHVAAPILYQDVVFHSDRSHFLEGVHVVSEGVSTRSAPGIANLKIPLLRHFKTMTIHYDKRDSRGNDDKFSSFRPRTLPRIETMRVKFHGLPLSTPCQCYDCNSLDGLPLSLLNEPTVNKLVLLPCIHLCKALYAWRLPLFNAEILTVILPSDRLDVNLGEALATQVLGFGVKLRLIISSWPDTEWCEVEESEDGDEAPSPIASEDSIMAWILKATSGSPWPVEVYVVERPWKRSHAPQQPVIPLKVRAAALFDAFEAEEAGWMERAEARVIFKDRKDYLMEGITDEVDGEELARWKRSQDWEDQASFYEQYHSVILDQRREEYDHYTNHPETIQEAQLVEEFQTDPDILLQDWEDRCVRAEEMAEWIVETQDWEDQANFHELDYRTGDPDAIPEAQLIEEYRSYPDIPLRHCEQRCVPAEELAEWIVETQDWEDQADFYNQDRSVTIYQQGVELDDRIDHPSIIPDAQLCEAYQSYLDILLGDWEQHGAQAEELAEWIDEAQIWEDQADFHDQSHPVIFDQPHEQVNYYINHPDTIPVAQLIDEYQVEANNLFLAEEQRHVAAAELAEWIDEGVTMTLVQELIYRHHFDNLFHPFRKARESSTIITNERNMLPTSEPTADE